MVERLTVPRPVAWASTALAVVAFGAAMGFLEAAVVVYLRSALGVRPGALPAVDPDAFGAFAGIEIARELATIVMIAAVGWLAGRSRFERLAWAAITFGLWDIVYYVGLWLTIGSPPSLETWDVLFLIPIPWVGPVWAPIVVSTALVGFGFAAARRLRSSGLVVVGAGRVLAALGGGGLVILSFLVDAGRVFDGDRSAWTGGPLFWAGMALATVATVAALMERSAPRAVSSERLQNGTEGRPPVGTSV